MNRFPRVLGVRTGYDPDQVDALIRRIEATLGRGTLEGPPVTADDIRMARFNTKLGGYNELAVDYALDAFIVAIETRGRPDTEYAEVVAPADQMLVARLPESPRPAPVPEDVQDPAEVPFEPLERLERMERLELLGQAESEESARPELEEIEEEEDDAPTLPGLAEASEEAGGRHSRPVTEVLTDAWLETQAARVERVVFRPGRLGAGYNEDEVDVFLDRIVATLRRTTDHPLTADQVRSATFSTVMFKTGYAVAQVDAFLAEVADILDRHGAHLGEQEQPA